MAPTRLKKESERVRECEVRRDGETQGEGEEEEWGGAKGEGRKRRWGRVGRHFIEQQCGRQKEREVEREIDYCLLESSNLELCHEYQRLYSPTVNASLSFSLLPR